MEGSPDLFTHLLADKRLMRFVIVLILLLVPGQVLVRRSGGLQRAMPSFFGTSTSWLRLAPPDILFRLGALAAGNLVLFWLPIYYWTTYRGSGDERDGGLLFPSLGFCPVSWALGGICFVQVWRRYQVISPPYRLAYQVGATLLMLVVLSTLVAFAGFFIRIGRA